MTPWQLSIAWEAHEENQKNDYNVAAFMMWNNACLSGRSGKHFPPLDQFLVGYKKPVNGVDESGIMARMKAYSTRFKKENGTGS